MFTCTMDVEVGERAINSGTKKRKKIGARKKLPFRRPKNGNERQPSTLIGGNEGQPSGLVGGNEGQPSGLVGGNEGEPSELVGGNEGQPSELVGVYAENKDRQVNSHLQSLQSSKENAENVENSEVIISDLNKGRGADLAEQELNNLGAKTKRTKKNTSTKKVRNSTSKVRKKRWHGINKKVVDGDEHNDKGKRRKEKVVNDGEDNGKGKGRKKNVDGDEDNHSATSEDSDWLLEGLEGSEDEDIFKNLRDFTSLEGASGSQEQSQPKGSSSSQNTEQNGEQNAEQNQFNEEEFVENFGAEPWNERVFNEEALLDTQLNDEEGYPAQVQHEFNAETEFKKAEFELKVGQEFRNLQVFREALVEWHVREGYVFKYERNERAKVTVHCKNGCGWRLHASPIQDTSTFQIKTIRGSHSCGREYNNPHATSTYLSRKLQHQIRDDPKISLEGLVSACKREYMVNISLKQAYWIRRKAIESMQGCDMEQYHKVRDYASAILKYNPGSRVTIQVQKIGENDIGTFHRMYWGLGALKDGFLHGCRPIIGLDGCFLKSSFRGQLLTAMGRDGNDNMFPIAIGVVEAERTDSWTWFLSGLKDQIGEGRWTFISYRQKGLVNAIEDVFPEAEHRFCLWHLYQNFKKKYKGKEYKDLFWAAASSGNKNDFKRALDTLEKIDPIVENKVNAAGWLKKIPPHLWTRSHFSSFCKSDLLVNNLNESFNSYILQARDKPVISMFEWIRRKLMQRIQIKRKGIEQYSGKLCPNIQERLEKIKISSRFSRAVFSSPGVYEVDAGLTTHVVRLDSRTCTCGLFQLTGIPCSHSVAAIQHAKKEVEGFVDSCYTKEVYLQAYNYPIAPLPSMEYWEDSNGEPINPPLVKKQPGRPKKMRMRDADEPRPGVPSTRKGLTIHCKRCFMAGHNSRFCNYPIHPKSRFYKEPEKRNGVDASVNSTSILEDVTDGNIVGRKRPLGGASSSSQSQPKKTKQPPPPFPLYSTVSNSEPPPPPHSTIFNVPTPTLNLKEIEKKKVNDDIIDGKKGKVSGVSSSSTVFSVPNSTPNEATNSSSVHQPSHRGRSTAPTISSVLKAIRARRK